MTAEPLDDDYRMPLNPKRRYCSQCDNGVGEDETLCLECREGAEEIADRPPEQPIPEGLDGAACSSSSLTGGGLISTTRENEPRMPSAEGYPEGWMHCKIHLNPATGEMHSDGDHRVRHWLQSRLDALKRIEGVIVETNAERRRPDGEGGLKQ